MRPRTLLLAAAAGLVAAVAAPSALASYPWPVKPFDEPHPVRGNFGDPRTIFYDPYDPDRFALNGSVSFHNGVDISAPGGTPVYPVMSGVVRAAGAAKVTVRSTNGHAFQYQHITPTVRTGQRVKARTTVLGYVLGWAQHVHLTEFVRPGVLGNPLEPGHLAPYYDGTSPTVASISFRSPDGKTLDPYHLRGTVLPVAEAYDVPALPVPAPWTDLPVAPALVRWSLKTREGHTVVPVETSVDFRYRIPVNREFWRVYAHGTYQNHPRFSDRQYATLPGRYVYRLMTGTLDTLTLPDGVYSVTVTAWDTRRNTGSRSQLIGVCNYDSTPCDQLAAEKQKPPENPH